MNEWIESTFGVSGSTTQALAVIIALVIVLLLFALFVLFLKKLSRNTSPQGRSRQPRIAVMDTASVDTKRRLVLVRRDNVEHLLLIGGPSDVVVEQQIIRSAPLTSGRHQGFSSNGTVENQVSGQIVKAPMAPGPDLAPEFAREETPPFKEPSASATTAAIAAEISAATTPTQLTADTMPTRTLADPISARPAEDAAPVRPVEPVTSEDTLKSQRAKLRAKLKERLAAEPSDASHPEPVEPQQPANDEPAIAAHTVDSPVLGDVVQVESKALVSESAAQTVTAPEIKAQPQPAAARRVTKPFFTAERPRYGAQSISPPASGPAAKAKTALFKTITRPEPPTEEAGTPEAPSVTASDKSTKTVGQDQPLIGEETEEKAPAPEAAEALSASNPDKVPDAEAKSKAGEATADSGDERNGKVVESGQTATSAATEDKKETGADDADADNGEIEINGCQTAPETEHATTADLKPHPQKQSPVSEDRKDIDEKGLSLNVEDLLEPQLDHAASPDIKATASDSRAPEIKIDPRPGMKRAQGLGDKNPIEEEMAKILDELGGQRR